MITLITNYFFGFENLILVYYYLFLPSNIKFEREIREDS